MRVYMSEIRNIPLLSREEEIATSVLVRKGDEDAANRLFLANLRFVVSVARQFSNRGMQMSDLISEGNLGLRKAVDRFDPTIGTRFTTYASLWIKQSIREALDRDVHPITFPAQALTRILKTNRVRDQLTATLGRPATHEEVAEATGQTVKQVTVHDTRRFSFLQIGRENPGEPGFTEDVLPDETAADPSQSAAQNQMTETVRDSLHILTAREQEIVRRRFGMDGRQESTLEEIGLDIGLTRERVRQIIVRCMRKLRDDLHANARISDSRGTRHVTFEEKLDAILA